MTLRALVFSIFVIFSLSTWAFTLPNSLDPVTSHERWNYLAETIDTVSLFPRQVVPAFDGRTKDLVDPQEGFLAKILAIRNAKHTIDVSTYIFKRDEVGYAILNELKDALRRGVVIRMLVDSTGSANLFHSELKSLLDVAPGFYIRPDGKRERAFVEVRVFNSVSHNLNSLKGVMDPKNFNSFFRWINRRSHDKLLLTDIQYPELAVAISGGRNLSNSYYGMPQRDAKTYNDLETLYRNGPSAGFNGEASLASTIGNHFSFLFYHQGNKILNFNVLETTSFKQFDKMAESVQKLIPPGSEVEKKFNTMIAGDFLSTDLKPTPIKFLFELENLSRPQIFLPPRLFPKALENPNSIIETTRQMMAEAKLSITIVSPYLHLVDETKGNEPNEVKLLADWVKADPRRKVTIVVNSILTTDNMPAQGMVDAQIKAYVLSDKFKGLENQVEIYQLGRLDDVRFSKRFGGDKTYGKLHAKFALIDGKKVLVTTSNADGRSRELNSELGFMIDGSSNPQDAAPYVAYLNDLISKSYNVRSPEWQQLVNAPELKKKEWLSRKAYQCVRLLRLINKNVPDLI